MDQILFIDKPKGMTSFDVIRRLRKKLGVRKMGHAGTLDPNASGLLIIGVGEDTKRLKEFMALPKTYIMDILLGAGTDTGDIEGRIIEQKPVADIPAEKMSAILREMIATIRLPIPAYSALKYKGRPRYVYARKGISIEPKMRDMEIYSLTMLGVQRYDYRGLASIVITVEMRCGKGTYARSVAEEIGRRLGVPATLRDLRRTQIGEFNVADAEKIE